MAVRTVFFLGGICGFIYTFSPFWNPYLADWVGNSSQSTGRFAEKVHIDNIENIYLIRKRPHCYLLREPLSARYLKFYRLCKYRGKIPISLPFGGRGTGEPTGRINRQMAAVNRSFTYAKYRFLFEGWVIRPTL